MVNKKSVLKKSILRIFYYFLVFLLFYFLSLYFLWCELTTKSEIVYRAFFIVISLRLFIQSLLNYLKEVNLLSKKDKKIKLIFLTLEMIFLGGLIWIILYLPMCYGGESPENRDAGRKSDIGQMGTACEAYYTRNEGVYPTKLEDLVEDGNLKILPRDPGGSDYSMAGGGTDDIVIYDKLEFSEGYWAYKSYCGRALKYITLEEATDLTDCSPE